MPFCPHCGVEILTEDTRFCPACGYEINSYSTVSQDTLVREGLSNHLRHSVTLVRKHPILLLPEFMSVIFTYILNQALGRSVDYFNLYDWFAQWLGINGLSVTNIADFPEIPVGFWILPFAMLAWLILLVGISGLFTFLTVHMAWIGVKDGKVDIKDSAGYVRSRLGKLFLASVTANLFALTVIMFPAALFMYSVMVVDFTGIRGGLSQGFRLFLDRIGTSIGLIIIYYVLLFAFGYVPYIGTYLRFLPAAILEIASLDLYMNYKLAQ
jgi:hypothetical protein